MLSPCAAQNPLRLMPLCSNSETRRWPSARLRRRNSGTTLLESIPPLQHDSMANGRMGLLECIRPNGVHRPWVETRVSDRLAVFCPWPKTLPDFPMSDPCFTGISDSSPRMAEDYPFRPSGIHHNAKRDRDAPEARDSSLASIPRVEQPVPWRDVAARPGSRRSSLRITDRCGSGS